MPEKNVNRRICWVALSFNVVGLLIAVAVWAWGEYRYVKLYRPQQELQQLLQWIVWLLPLFLAAGNLYLLRRLSWWQHILGSLLLAAVFTGLWWWLFHTVGVRWHYMLGGT